MKSMEEVISLVFCAASFLGMLFVLFAVEDPEYKIGAMILAGVLCIIGFVAWGVFKLSNEDQ